MGKNHFLLKCLNGASQVFFMENAVTGLLFLAAIGVASSETGNWTTSIGALLGLIIATTTAELLDLDADATASGLYGFNGILIGVALPTFILSSAQLWFYIAIGAALSTVVTAAAAATLTKAWGIPGSTGPFVLVGWLMVAGAYSFGGLTVTSLSPKLGADLAGATLAVPPPMELGQIFLRNIGQVFLLSNPISGALILAGVFIASIPGGIAVAAGSAVAIIVSILMGADPTAIREGLYGFSPVLTALAVGVVFLKPSVRVALYALLATVVTVVVQGALDIIMLPDGLPSFTAPYVLTMYLFIAPKTMIAPHPHRPVADHPAGADRRGRA